MSNYIHHDELRVVLLVDCIYFYSHVQLLANMFARKKLKMEPWKRRCLLELIIFGFNIVIFWVVWISFRKFLAYRLSPPLTIRLDLLPAPFFKTRQGSETSRSPPRLRFVVLNSVVIGY